MFVRNARRAALTLPGGLRLEPGDQGDTDAAHRVVSNWIAAGWLVPVAVAAPVVEEVAQAAPEAQPEPVEDAPAIAVPDSIKAWAEPPKRRRRGG